MTEDVEPMVRVDPERSKAFVRGLIPRAIMEAVVLMAGVAAFLMTEQMVWIVVAVIVGSAPVVLYVLKYARENAVAVREAQQIQAGGRVVRNIVE